MSDFQLYALIGLGLYFGAMVIIGLFSAKKESHEGYMIGSRNVGLIPTAASLTAGFRDGSGAVFWISAGFGLAYGGIWMFVGFLFALAFFWVFGSQIRQRARENGYITIGEMIRDNVGVTTERSVSAIIVLFATLVIAMQLYVSGNIFATILGFDSWIGIGAIALVVGFYMYFGGYGTVVKTDTLQFFIMLSIVIFPFLLPPSKADFTNFGTALEVDFDTIFGLFVIGGFYLICSADSWQRVFSAKSDTVVKFGFPLAALLLMLVTFSLVWLGMGYKNAMPDTDPATALFTLFQTEGLIHPAMLAFLAVGLMAITMSTLDSMCYLCASTLAKNLTPNKWTDNKEKYIKFTRVIIIFLLIGMSIVALQISDIVQFLFSIVSLIYIVSPLYVFTGLGTLKPSKKLDVAVTISVGLGISTFIPMFAMGAFEKLSLTGVPVLVSAVAMGISVKLFNKA